MDRRNEKENKIDFERFVVNFIECVREIEWSRRIRFVRGDVY